MRKLRIFEHISLDGVVQVADTDGNFPYRDWTAAYRSPAGRDELLAAQGERFDLLLGRSTYDLWSGYWPNMPSSPMADRLNAATKFVVTHRADGLRWGPVEALGQDVVADVRRVKAEDGPNLLLWGSSTLTSVLLQHGIVDELFLIVYPILLGTGKRLFAEGSPACSFEHVSTKAMPSGVVLSSYRAARLLERE